MANKKSRPGDLIRIKIGEDAYGFGRIVEGEFIEFFDLQLPGSETEDVASRLRNVKVLFTLSVHKSWKKNLGWEVIGNNPESLSPIPDQFMQNIGNPADIQIVDSAGNVRPGTVDEAESMERLAVWEDNHVEDRLRDHFANRPNVWSGLMKPKRPS